MAGRPKMNADLARLGVEPELGETVLGMLAEGRLLSAVCYETGLGKAALLKWLDETPERAEAFARARASAAHSMATEAIEIADEADEENPGSIAKAKLRTQVRQWTAERWGRQVYGQAKAEVNISLNGLHFDALRHRTIEAEVVDVTPARIDTRPTDDELASL